MKCKCCERNVETRIGVCFDCAEVESIIADGTDMYDKGLTEEQKEGLSPSLQKVKLLVIKNYLKYVKYEHP